MKRLSTGEKNRKEEKTGTSSDGDTVPIDHTLKHFPRAPLTADALLWVSYLSFFPTAL